MAARTTVDRSFFATCLLLVGVAAVVQAVVVTRIVASRLEIAPPAPLVAMPREESRSVHATSAAAIVANNPLDSTMRDLRPLPPGPTAPPSGPNAASFSNPYLAPSCPGVRVVATAAADDASRSFALLAGGSGEPAAARLVRRGERYGEREVWFVAFDRAFLSDGASLCQAEMFAPAAPTPSSSASGAPAPSTSSAASDASRGIRRNADRSFDVERSTFDRFREAPQDVFRGVRALPETIDGKPSGVRLFGLKGDSPLSTLGLQNGDRLEKINGIELGDPESLLRAYAALAATDRFHVEITRGGQRQTIDVALH